MELTFDRFFVDVSAMNRHASISCFKKNGKMVISIKKTSAKHPRFSITLTRDQAKELAKKLGKLVLATKPNP